MPRAAPNLPPSGAKCESSDPCRGSRCAPPSVPAPRVIPRGGTPAPGPQAPLFSHLPGPGARPPHVSPGFQLRPHQLAAAVGNLPPPPLSFGFPGSPSPMPSVSFIFSPLPGAEYPRSLPGQGFWLGQGQGSRVLAGGRPLPPARLGTGLGLGRRLAPGACPLLAPRTVQFIHEPPGPALEGAVGTGFRGGTRSGAKALLGGGGALCPSWPS